MFKLLLATFIFTTLLAIAFLNSRFRERTVFLKRLQK